MPFVTILWGEDPRGQQTELYEFDTIAERQAFMKGVCACEGWGAWEQLDSDEDTEVSS